MQCSSCNHLNSATDVRCFNCGTTLIYEAVGHSKEYERASQSLSVRMHSGIGALLGFFLVAVLLKFILTSHFLSDRQVMLASAGAAVVGSFLGRLFLRAKRNV
jgi:hypothetical protein